MRSEKDHNPNYNPDLCFLCCQNIANTTVEMDTGFCPNCNGTGEAFGYPCKCENTWEPVPICDICEKQLKEN